MSVLDEFIVYSIFGDVGVVRFGFTLFHCRVGALHASPGKTPANYSTAFVFRLPFCAPPWQSCLGSHRRNAVVLTAPPPPGGSYSCPKNLAMSLVCGICTASFDNSQVNRQTLLALSHPIAWRNRMTPQWFSVVCLSTLPQAHRDPAT